MGKRIVGLVVACVLGLAGAAQAQTTLRIVNHSDLKILDPVWTTGYITRNHGYLVYDTLFGTDETQQIKPQMVDHFTASADGMKYTFTLRYGLRWHDGQPVRSEDCVESLKRWGKRDRFGGLLMAHTAKITAIGTDVGLQREIGQLNLRTRWIADFDGIVGSSQVPGSDSQLRANVDVRRHRLREAF